MTASLERHSWGLGGSTCHLSQRAIETKLPTEVGHMGWALALFEGR